MIPSTVVCDAVLNVLLLDIHHIKYENAGMSAVVCGREMYFHILNLNYFIELNLQFINHSKFKIVGHFKDIAQNKREVSNSQLYSQRNHDEKSYQLRSVPCKCPAFFQFGIASRGRE